MQRTNERNAKGRSITINFHSHWGEETVETYLKAKFCRRASLHDPMQIILQAKAKAWVFADCFCSHFNACGFSNPSKTWIRLRSNNVCCAFLLLKSEKLLWICDLLSKLIKLTWKCSDLHVFTTVVGRRTSSPERFEDFARNVLERSLLRQIDQNVLNILYNPIGQLNNRKNR